MAKLDRVSSAPSDDATGQPTRVGPYRIEHRIGAGGMGEVYKAYDRRLDRHVAVKHIHPESAEDPKIRRRLRREAHAVAKLNHPAIVQIYDILEGDDGDWIVMELIEGRTLHELLKAGRLNLAQALFLVSEVANGLAEAHSKGVVHRDLKTENVMVTPDGHAKILDFGLAKLLLEGAGDTILSIHGTIVGTGRAMSPEQAKGETIDHRSDLFSLGSLLYEVATGRPPFMGTSIISTLTRICSDIQPSARDLRPQVDEELSDLIDRLLSKNAADRPDSSDEVAATLMDIAARLAPEQGEAVAGGRGERPEESTRLAPTPTPLSRVRRPESSQSVFIKTLMSVSLHRSEQLHQRLGNERSQEVALRHDRLVRDLLIRWAGVEVSKGGSFLLVLERPMDAVELALAYHRKLEFLADELGLESGALRGRIAIHLGEIFYREDDPTWGNPPFEVDAAARRIVVRTEAMATPGQTLLTQGAHDIARRALAGLSRSGASHADAEPVWIAHGKYRFTRIGGTVRLFEVRSADVPALPPPADTDEARRIGDPTAEVAAPEFSELARPRNRWRGGLVLASAAALVAIGMAAIRLGDRYAGGGSAASVTVAFEGIQDLSTGPDSAWMSAAVSEMLAAHLESGDGLRVLPTPILDPDYLISGSYRSVGDGEPSQLRVELEMRGAGGEPRVYTELGARDDLPELISRLGTSVRADLKLPPVPPGGRRAFRAAWPSNAAALRLYTEALAKMRSIKPRKARDLLIRAIANEPGHAPAHAALAEVLLALDETALAAESVARATALRDGLPERWSLRVEGLAREVDGCEWLRTSRLEEARQAFEEARGLYGKARDAARVERVAARLGSLANGTAR